VGAEQEKAALETVDQKMTGLNGRRWRGGGGSRGKGGETGEESESMSPR
jgi:hypothetical protein